MTTRATSALARIIVLLAVIVLLVAGIAWQAQRSVTAQRQTATAVLGDYAELAADEFARQAMAATGYRGYYAAVNTLRSREVIETGPSPVLSRFEIDTAAGTANADIVAFDEILERLSEPPPDSPFQTIHIVRDDRQHTYVLYRTQTENTVSGFEVDRAWLAATLDNILAGHVLLPESLGDGRFSNDDLSVRFEDAAGNPLIDTGQGWRDAPVATRTLSDEYGGIFRGHTISVAIDPAMADALLIGGLPRSRLPELFVILGIVFVLLLLVIRQIQREATLARLRNDFVAEVSHELRTPLTQIRMFTESLMLDRLRSDDDRTRALTVIDRESRRLGAMVENILRFSRAARRDDELNVADTELGALIESVTDEFRPLADANGSRIVTDLDDNVTCRVDGDALRQVLLNLLDNAIKYGPDAQEVRVSMRKSADGVVIAVADEGPGIPDPERARIWDSYVRLDRERASAIAGTGIGLAVVHELVKRHGGHVRIESSASGGARFVIELPP